VGGELRGRATAGKCGVGDQIRHQWPSKQTGHASPIWSTGIPRIICSRRRVAMQVVMAVVWEVEVEYGNNRKTEASAQSAALI
jgi:hypothetical protein